jgi:hypothetical protein
MELRYCEECGDVIQVENAKPLTELEHFICERCESGRLEPRAGAGGGQPAEDIQSQSLNLFSPETIAIRKKQYESTQPKDPKANRLRLVKPGAAGEPAPDGGPEDEGTGSASPAQGARKILFRCLHCKATLAIRPVDRTSKLNCPHCAKTIFVTAAGTLLKASPSVVQRATEVRPNPSAPGGGPAPAVPRRPGSSVGFRSTASREEGSAIQPPRIGGSSRRLSKNPVRTAPGERAEGIALKEVNPATTWMPKQPSAFEEHRELEDPNKTAFITDVSPEDLKDLATSKALAGVAEQFALPSLKDTPPPPSPRLGDLLPEDDGDADMAPRVKGRARVGARRPGPLFTGGRPSVLEVAARGILIVLCLSAPAVLAMTFLQGEATARGNGAAGAMEKPGPLEHIGKITEKGILRLRGGSE